MKLPWQQMKRQSRQVAAPPLQQYRACPSCGVESDLIECTDALCSLKDFQFFTDQQGLNRADHRIVACAHCGLLYTNPCYTPSGFQQLFAKAGLSYGHTAERIVEQVEWVARHFPQACSLLDVGCGGGDLLKALPQTMQRFGLDVDALVLETAAKNAPDVVFEVCDFDGLSDLPQTDVITLFHVLEHLANPAQFLKQLRQLAKKGTQLVVEVPVVERAVVEQDRDIVGFFTIQHLTHFSKVSLENMLAASGWQVTHVEAMSGYNGWRVVAEPKTLNTSKVAKDKTSLPAANAYLTVWRDNIASVEQRIATLATAPQIMVWGGGQHTEYLALLTGLFKRDAEFVIVDSDPLKQGQTYHGIPVLAPEQVLEAEWLEGEFPIVISTYGGQESVVEILAAKGVDPLRVMTLYDRTQRY